MRTNVAARYARWSAVAACLVALIVGCLYLRRVWEVRQARQEIPAEVPPTVQQQSAGFSFSKVEGEHTEFTVRAAKATEYATDGRSLLENVWVTLYGRLGERFDNLRTHSCEYMAATGDIYCAGEVQIDLQSAEDAKLHPAAAGRPNAAARIIHVSTSGVTFNQKTGQAATDHAVAFRFPRGDGRGVGFRYDSERGQIHLLRDVQLAFYQPASPSTIQPSQDGAGDLKIAGSSLIYFRDERLLRLLGPVSAHQEARELSAERLEVEFDAELRARRLVATGSPVLREAAFGTSRTIAADKISTAFSAAGLPENSTAEGNVHATAEAAGREDQLNADHAQLEFATASSSPRRLTATGNVRAQSVLSGGASRRLETSEINLDFAKRDQRGATRIEHAATPAAILDFQGTTAVSGRGVPEQIRLTSQHLDADFSPDNLLRQVVGKGGVEVRRQIGDQPVQMSASREMTAHFAPDGDWSTVDQSGEVRANQADQSASAERAHFDHGSDTVALSGSVQLSDSRTRTTARSGLLHQGEHQFQAEGRVVSNDISATSSLTNLGPGPARISSDRMVADTSTGHATYSGSARLWQGDILVEADTIELDRATQNVTATGRVRAILPQAHWNPSGKSAPTKTSTTKNEYMHAQARRMTYDSNEGRGRLEGDAQAQSDQGTIRSDVMDLFFAPVESAEGDAAAVAATKSAASGIGVAGSKQLVRATADGHVLVDQEDRQGMATHADYTAEAGKIVLTGGPPTVHDSSGNVTTGRQLTFYFRDDTINIDSAEGMRTLTLHRVEK